ncbi:hypothetical protein AMS68_001463 [Peltaster fructicola]|uniref:Major facilitator superfamily (MFS) profile domain-containing protein n=1 Tax=Peltaster fructicola TaxID=286661 RepID=A0A6H0XML1_9PEZI|nr:hypothetical protein AMS68_001463 [Peltaster fructicola]
MGRFDSSPEFEGEKNLVEDSNTRITAPNDLSDGALDGIKKARATTIVWSRSALIFAYALIFLIFFVNSLQQQITNNLGNYVVSDFATQGLYPITGVVSQLVAGIIKLPVARLMDIWGRPLGYVVMLFTAVIGLIIMAACRNVETYAAGQVFYWVGFDGIAFVLDVFIADTSSLRSRALMFAFSTSPYIATTFAGPAAAQSFYQTSGWPWAYGTFAIITPLISLPFLSVFAWNQRLARKQGIIQDTRAASGRTVFQSIAHYLIEFDFIGILLLAAGFAIFLLPFSLAQYQNGTWASSLVISMLVVGFVLIIIFGLHEKFFARRPFLPFQYLTDRTVLGACINAGVLFLSFYCWDAYFSPFLQVVYGLTISEAGYVSNIYNIGSCFFAIIIGAAIYATGWFKWTGLVAVPIQILGTGLMIYFRQPNQSLGYVIMCQIFISASGGALVISQQLAIMAAVGLENVASALALLGLFNAVGGAVGSSISAAIWTNTFPQALATYLPASAQGDIPTIFGSLVVQLEYAMGTPERDGIIEAYGHSQRIMCIAATSVLVLNFVGVCLWRNINVKNMKPAGTTVI